ncbi:MAG TPA: hypothetical protein VG963_07180 [Polyangiaceae bacterium]|nr:hypothetical protein [Polyangiaceae bacterium]
MLRFAQLGVVVGAFEQEAHAVAAAAPTLTGRPKTGQERTLTSYGARAEHLPHEGCRTHPDRNRGALAAHESDG